MRKTLSIIILTLCLLCLVGCGKTTVDLVFLNNQVGIIANTDKLTIDNEEKALYRTRKDKIQLTYSIYYGDNDYHNKVIINDTYEMPLLCSDEFDSYQNMSIDMLGLNIIDGKIKITIASGTLEKYDHPNYNDFSLKNVKLKIADTEIWSSTYTQEDYENVAINFGEDNMNSSLRSIYKKTRDFVFEVSDDLLDTYGILVENQKEYLVNEKKNTFKLFNPAFIDASIVLDDNISGTTTIKVTSNGKPTLILDGIEIPNDLMLTKGSWAKGKHNLVVIITNDYGFVSTIEKEFTIEGNNDYSKSLSDVEYYNLGITDTLPNDTEIGKLTPTLFDPLYANNPVITFKVKSDNNCFVWEGTSPFDTVYMQIFNYKKNIWETVSTAKTSDNNVELGYCYTSDYEKDEQALIRVASKNTELELNITDYIMHFTDIQYITLATVTGKGTIIGDKASKALTNVKDYVTSSNVKYILSTGDFVQKTVVEDEWNNVSEYVLKPIKDSKIPFGFVTGNHDVGGLAAVGGSSNALDDKLVYDYWNKYSELIDNSDEDYYGDSFNDYHSHYDIIKLNNKEFMFMMLGWSSSIIGIHVTENAIKWANEEISKNQDKVVVLCLHDYLGSHGKRTTTGEYIYNTIVKKNANVEFVFSGHIDGSSYLVDTIDDNKDGITDRRVFQMVSNFQEVEDLYGATFVRRLGLDYKNNLIKFDLYSPYINDYDVFGQTNVKNTREANLVMYYYDFENIKYGLTTSRIA